MPDIPDDRASSAGNDFLMIDLDLALTFMDIAETTKVAATAHRNREKALEAYNAVKGFLSRPTSIYIDRHSVETKMHKLKARLDAAGYRP